MRKIIVAGGRDFTDYEFMRECMERVVKDDDVEIVSGTARGADSYGEMFAEEYELELIKFPADWKKYNRAAGPIRNEAMAEYADELCAFWDGRSSGTKHMIKYARKIGLEVRIFHYE